MWGKTGLALAVILALAFSGFAQASVVEITLSVDKPLVDGKFLVGIGETATLSVYVELKPAAAVAGRGTSESRRKRFAFSRLMV